MSGPASAQWIVAENGSYSYTPGGYACGTTTVFPVLAKNNTNVAQTGSVSIAPSTVGQVLASAQPILTTEEIPCYGEVPVYENGAEKMNFTAQPGQTVVIWIAIGGNNEAWGVSQSFGLGGRSTQDKGVSWYEMQYKLGSGYVFQSLWAVYGMTGGPATNNGQNGFTNRACNVTKSGTVATVSVGTEDISPYKTSHGFTTYPSGPGQALCFSWG